MEIKQTLDNIRGTVVFNVLIGSDEETTPVSKSFSNLQELTSVLDNSPEEFERTYDSKSVKVERIIFSGKTDEGSDMMFSVNKEGISGYVKPVVHQAELDLSILEEVEKIKKLSENIIDKTRKDWNL